MNRYKGGIPQSNEYIIKYANMIKAKLNYRYKIDRVRASWQAETEIRIMFVRQDQYNPHYVH